jgi:hypothetical protein
MQEVVGGTFRLSLDQFPSYAPNDLHKLVDVLKSRLRYDLAQNERSFQCRLAGPDYLSVCR